VNIRRAGEKDVRRVSELLSQVLEIHARIRPEIFIAGTTKYTPAELIGIFENDRTPVYVATDERDEVVGYVFCVLKEVCNNNMHPFKAIFIDDLCVDESQRGRHTGEALFRFVLDEAKRLGCREVTLNVWEGNGAARRFYEKMGMRPRETQMEYMLS